MNFAFSGFGTIVCGYLEKTASNKTQMWVGLLQFFLAPYLVGWIWAQYQSYLIVMKAIKGNETANSVLNTV